MDGPTTLDATCQQEGHNWRGRSICSRCGDRLRCILCGRYVREDDSDNHLLTRCVQDWRGWEDMEPEYGYDEDSER